MYCALSICQSWSSVNTNRTLGFLQYANCAKRASSIRDGSQASGNKRWCCIVRMEIESACRCYAAFQGKLPSATVA